MCVFTATITKRLSERLAGIRNTLKTLWGKTT